MLRNIFLISVLLTVSFFTAANGVVNTEKPIGELTPKQLREISVMSAKEISYVKNIGAKFGRTEIQLNIDSDVFYAKGPIETREFNFSNKKSVMLSTYFNEDMSLCTQFIDAVAPLVISGKMRYVGYTTQTFCGLPTYNGTSEPLKGVGSMFTEKQRVVGDDWVAFEYPSLSIVESETVSEEIAQTLIRKECNKTTYCTDGYNSSNKDKQGSGRDPVCQMKKLSLGQWLASIKVYDKQARDQFGLNPAGIGEFGQNIRHGWVFHR